MLNAEVSEPIRWQVRHGATALVLALAAASFFIGISWGLPTRAADPYLFGERNPWSGADIVKLAPADTDERGADVDANPIADRTQVVVLNETDAQRAEIVRRYRLFSYQPDEMITFKSLSRLRENNGDPRLYQYGGLWIYPVGALLKLASIVGYVDLRSDQAFYLDHPEAFGRFYVIARIYAAIFGMVGAWAVMWIVRHLKAGMIMSTAAGLCFAAMPVVVNLAHEAKPHLPATTLMLLAVIAAIKYVETGSMKWAAVAGALCGASFGMVLSGLLAFAILFVMVFLRDGDGRRRMPALALAMSLGALTYVLTNPFVIINILTRPQRFQSNLENSTNMYATTAGGLTNALSLIMEGASPLLAFVGVCGIFFLARERIGRLLLAPAVLVAVMFVALAAGKPPEYARFALPLDVTLLIAAFTALGRARHHWPRIAMATLLVAFTVVCAVPYWRGFIRDCAPVTSRLAAAAEFQRRAPSTLRLAAEPAPYNLPPVDLFRTRLELIPPPADDADIIVDRSIAPNSLSWADVRFMTRPPPPATVSSSR
jgi:hypothetical protein